jgi:WD40 repeat protein
LSGSAAVDLTARVSPYKGLVPYGADDSSFFFGRGRERNVVIANLRARHLTVIYGESGVGKSSLLHAGVLSELRRQAREDLEDRETPEFIPVAFSSWRDDPVTGLLDAVRSSVAQIVPGRKLQTVDDENLPETLNRWARDLDCEFLIILDQFEEYFLYHGQEEGEKTFDSQFPAALNYRQLRASFLLTIREDAFAKLDRFKTRVPSLLDNYLRIRHLDERCAREAIERPLEAWSESVEPAERVEIEPALVKAILGEVQSGIRQAEQAGQGVVEQNGRAGEDERVEAPYLQLVLTRLWDEETKEGSHKLRLATLQRLGGAERIVQNHLNEAMSALPPDEQEIAAAAFYYLVTPEGTKIAQSVETLAAYSGRPAADLNRVLEKLATGGVRIVRPVAPAPGARGGTRYEIFHDVLASAILDWRTGVERIKLERDREQAERKQAEAQRQARIQRRRAVEFRALAVLFGALFVGAGALGIWALHQKNVAQGERASRLSRALAADASLNLDTDPELSLLLARNALGTKRTPEAEEALRESLMESHVRVAYRGHEDAVNSVAFSPHGKLLLTGSDDNMARLWNAATGKAIRTLRGHTKFVSNAAFSPDGKLIATASWDKTARIWDTATGHPVGRPLRGHQRAVQWASFSPNGKLIVTGSRDRTVRIWDTATRRSRAVFRGHGDYLNTVEFSPNGRLVVSSADDHTARIWSVATGRQLHLLQHRDQVNGAAFSPDGSRVVTASSDNTAQIWDVHTGRSLKTFRHGDRLSHAEFSPDGKLVVTTSLDQTARIWEVSSSRSLLVLRGHTGPVVSAAFSPSGDFVATASLDHTARLWKAPSEPKVLRHPAGVFSAAFSPDGRAVATASADGLARVFDPARGRPPAVLRSNADPALDVAFSRDGKFLVTAGGNGAALWNRAARQVIKRYEPPTPADGTYPPMAVLSTNGKLVLIAGYGPTPRVFDAASGNPAARFRGSRGVVNHAAFTADGKSVATVSDDGSARVFDTATGDPKAVLNEGSLLRGQIPLYGVAFSPDGKILVTAGEQGTVKLWDVERKLKVANLRGLTEDVLSATFSPDGHLIVTTGSEGTVQLWDRATARSVGTLSKQKGQVLRAAMSPSGKQVVTAGMDDATARIVNCEVCAPIGDLARLASTRVTRELSPQERSLYLED